MANEYEKEEMLKGGNISDVFRSGNTVRRDLKPDNDKIHMLLNHLESKGFGYSPRFLGVDEKDREILSFIEGEAGNYPLKKYMWSDHVLSEIAKMLRLYHDAVSDFPLINEWKPMDHTPDNIEVVCHNDFAIYNIIFNQESPVGIIDFDVAAPGPRLWDIAYTLYTCVPLSRLWHNEKGEAIYYNPSEDSVHIKQRIHLFFESYGDKEMQQGFLEMVLLRVEGLCKYMLNKANEGDVAFQKMIDEGQLDHYQKEIQFIREYGKEWV
ncbi:phosphotransferase [Bacillus sp. B1-b2]|uniref:phosphotransferase n=1 Tax=Bacillus sp. B1-b2 TaxID=2653201 RepID=UPI001262A455|nr:phosphotransferase [Bacillus sp. B1-b2]KAB7672064.1 aminoglycoside phosphotransferase family protein [Bacillus sp. B1-b2]